MLFATFNILSLIFGVLVTMCFGVFLSMFILYGTTLHFLGLRDIFLLRLGSFQLLHLQIFSLALSILSFSDPTI